MAEQRRRGGENSKAKKAPEPREPLDVTVGRKGVLDTIQHAVESTVALDNSAARNATLGKLAALAMDVLEPSKVEDMEAEVAALRETLTTVRKVMRRASREPWDA